MTIKTWQERFDNGPFKSSLAALGAMQAEIDELRAALDAWEKQEQEYYRLYQQHTWLRVEKKQFYELKPGHRMIRYANPNENEKS